MGYPAKIFETTTGGVHNPKKESDTILESHLNITSLKPISHAKETPTSMAFASVSRRPKG